MSINTALPSSGAISLGDVQTEFGGSNPVSMNEYYKDASYTNHDGVGVSALNSSVPTSGTIDMADFRGGIGSYIVTISSSTTNFNLRNYLVNTLGWNQSAAVAIHIVINSGIVVSATSTGTAALTCNLTSGSLLSILNNGTIVGKGGAGGSGGSPGNNGGSGGAGGHAIDLQNIGQGVLITNNNVIGGGGGGGGGNGGYRGHGSSNDHENNCSGGVQASGAAGGKGRDTTAAGHNGGNYGASGSNGAAGGATGCGPVNGSGGAGAAGGKAIRHVSGVGAQTINGSATHSYNNTNGIGGTVDT